VPASRGREILAHVRSLFKQGFVVLIAADPARFAAVAGETAPGLDTWIHVPFQLGELASRANYATLVGQMLGAEGAAEPLSRDAATSALDQPMSTTEVQLLAGLAPLAGSSARALKRSSISIALPGCKTSPTRAHLLSSWHLTLAARKSEIAAVNDALSRANPEADLDLQHCGARLVEALAAAQAAQGKINVNAARHAAATARLFSFRDGGLSGVPVAARVQA